MITGLADIQQTPDTDGTNTTFDVPCTINGGPVRLDPALPAPTPTPTVTPTPAPTPTPIGTPGVIDTPAPDAWIGRASALATCEVPLIDPSVVKVELTQAVRPGSGSSRLYATVTSDNSGGAMRRCGSCCRSSA